MRVLRVIARMNMGGPAYQVSLLSGRLDPARYETLLACGDVGPGEESMAYLAERYGAKVEPIDGLGPRLRPLDDVRALITLVRMVREYRPDIVHTHTAKAGFLGRMAATIAVRPRPLIVHTYHGHVLEGYFGRVTSSLYRLLERLVGRTSDRLIGVSQATVDDLVRLGIARREKFRVVPLGLDLAPFAALGRARSSAAGGADSDGYLALRTQFRAELRIDDSEVLATYVGRIVPIKRLDVLLRAMAVAREAGARVSLAVIGDGASRPALERAARELAIEDQVHFLGYRTDLDCIAAGADLAVLASDNEGTPVSLIEAAVAGLPAAATDVGGVAEVVVADSGILVRAGDSKALGRAIAQVAGDESVRRCMGENARRHASTKFSGDRLIRDIEQLYEAMLTGSSTQ